MTYAHNRVVGQIARMGERAEVKTRSETGQNEFGNVQHEWTIDRTVPAFRTYPNRNTQVESGIGERDQDRPVFLVPIRPDLPAVPEEGDRLVYGDTEYEVKSHTPYDTHVEFFGEPIIH